MAFLIQSAVVIAFGVGYIIMRTVACKCPACKESVKTDATKCKHCRTPLPPGLLKEIDRPAAALAVIVGGMTILFIAAAMLI